MTRISRLLSFLFFALVTAAQTPGPASPTPDELIVHARRTYAQEGPKAALPEFERALATFRESKDRRHEAITLGYIGNCYRRLGDFPRALDFVRRGMEIKRSLGDKLEVGKSHNQFGLIYWETADYVKAIDHLQEAVAIGRELSDHELEAQARNNLGLVYDEMGDYRHSLEQYQHTLEIDRASHSDGEADTLANIGGVHLLLGQYRDALDYYQQALAIHERLGLKPTASIDLGNMGICYSAIGEGEKALASFDRALKLAREAGLSKEQADWHKARGTALLRLGKFDPAIGEYQQAEKVYETAGLKRELVEALNETGDLRLMLGDTSSAEADYRRALELAKAIGNDHGVTTNLMSLGELDRRRKRYREAENQYNEALIRARKVDDRGSAVGALVQLALIHREQGKLDVAEKEAHEAAEVAKASAVPPAEARALFALAEVQRSQQHLEQALQQYSSAYEIEKAVRDPDLDWRLAYGRGQTLEKLNRDQDALAAYKQAVAIIEDVRSQLAEERFRAGYIEDKYQVYVALVELLLKLEKPAEAFFYSEKLRARAFLDQLNRGAPRALSEAQRREEFELRERVRQLRRATQNEWERPEKERRNEALERFSTELASAEQAYQNLLDGLRRSAPAYAMTHALSVPTSGEVQQLLPPDTALVEYVITQDRLAFLVLTSDQVRGTTLPISAEKLESRVELLRDLIVRADSDDWRPSAAGLRQVLIGSLEEQGWLKGIRRLYLVPNGFLNYVPFAALSRTTGRSRFLVDDYVLAYLPSAAALVYVQGDPASHPKLLAVAPERAHLQYAEQEARDVSRLFHPRALLLTGKSATKGSFERMAGNYQFLHLATHGYLNRYTPMLSGLELEPDTHDDGLLEVHEILDLKLHASLVTLSACETALGSGYFSEVPAGDDFVGFTRAFLSAGSQAVLASLWAVNDRSTLQLMVDFYRRLPKEGKAAALAKTQRAMRLSGGRYSHPYFWAPFVLVGKLD
jgi:CHAT domain-containing protein/Tfp pilus assembly protein PilF/predicted negative regulator of RcsB-dependent stress response